MISNSDLQAHFYVPPVRYRPWTRWWWPGGAVDPDELLREMRLFSETMFGGVEIQPFVSGMNPETLNDHSSPIYDYDSPDYYAKLVAVLEAAQRQGMQVDLTMGSGWPPGGSFVPLEDNVNTLLYGEATISRAVDMPVPPPIMPFAYAMFSSTSILPMLRGREWTQTLTYHPEAAQLVAVVAAKIVDNQRSPDPSVLTDTIYLDMDSVMDISDCVEVGHLKWEPPSTEAWQIISLYTMPSGSHLLIAAVADENYVVDPFDTQAIIRYYNNWIGKHPELLAHAGQTLRALFSDSYEYFAQRLFADDFIETFRANRGYDITPFLPAVFRPGRDQHFFFFAGLRTAPDFSFGELSERIIYDYDLTVSDLFFKHWYPASRDWIEQQNLHFRQQGYNPPLDVIKAAGAASIPETEGGNALWLKRVASGGHLYGRPIVSAESFVFMPQSGFALTPQDYKQGIDLLMAAGVNHIIYHGTPYRWAEAGYGEIGWSPFISPYGALNISSNISEADTFWKYQDAINLYAARLQLLLRQGNPDADLLVYLPVFDNPDDARFLPVVTALDASGYAWEWGNDDLIAQAEWFDAGLLVGGMVFQGLVLPDIEALPVATAEKLAALSRSGLPVAIFGQKPSRQPGYLNYAANDRRVADSMDAIVSLSHNALMTDPADLTAFIGDLPRGAITYDVNPALCYIRRKLDDGRYLVFIRNTRGEATPLVLKSEASLVYGYGFDAQTGAIYALAAGQSEIVGRLPAFGSLAILCSPEPMFSADELSPGNPLQEAEICDTIPLTDWQLTVTGEDVPGGEFAVTMDALGDWCQRERLKYVSSVGTYTTTLSLSAVETGKRYRLDLGAVFAAADVAVNGQQAGAAIFSPYQVDVTDYLTVGDNTIVIAVTPALRNRLVGKARAGDPEYVQFAGGGAFGNANPIPSGLVGPVTLYIVEANW